MENSLANPLIYLVKRVLDYAAAALIFLALLPLMLGIAILIMLGSAGPAMYRQSRVGKNGRLFYCYKFRTMYVDSEARLRELLRRDPQARQEWAQSYKLPDDPRVTPIGRFLRRSSLDELPQLLNILRGEMSLVGPRPVVREELEKYYGEDVAFYLRVPPGLTGLWQVSGRSDTTYEHRVSLDSWYVKNWSLWLDMLILFKTVGVVLNREGAR
ncbi:MAG: exopolysaccharide biosynthesis polyprenyl glycosylphosphotransferase [Elusimicrobia bacterium]|nr:exopolysaccharide biosynthesis polyprenyl glycosylphosphotransferase [Elusimicrobiota bacterium]